MIDIKELFDVTEIISRDFEIIENNYIQEDSKDDECKELIDSVNNAVVTLMHCLAYPDDVIVVDESDYEEETEKLNTTLELIESIKLISEYPSHKNVENLEKARKTLNEIIENRG